LFSDLKDETKQEILGVVLIALSVLSYIALATSAAGGFGEMAQRFLNAAFGRAAWVIPGLVGAAGLLCVFQQGHVLAGSRAFGWALALVVCLGWLHRFEPGVGPGYEFRNWTYGLGGGAVGGAVTWGLRQVLGPVGRDVFLAALTLIAFLVATDVSLLRFLRAVRDLVIGSAGWLGRAGVKFVGLFEEPKRPARAGRAVKRPDSREARRAEWDKRPAPGRRPGPEDDEEDEIGVAGSGRERRAELARTKPRSSGATGAVPGLPASGYEQITLTEDLLYQLPPLSLLDQAPQTKGRRVKQDIEEKTRILEETLESFGVRGRVVNVQRGPVVTCFEVQPAPGVKVARIVGLADDLALALAARDIRIEAPIPGKRAVGIEVPNTEVATVGLREVLEEPEVQSAPSKLNIVFGKDITGRPIIGDLGRLLHVLIAGATGSGKSVCINSIIASLLFRAKPGEVKLLLIDPKVVELNVYEGIPHLVSPVVTDPKKAAGCLRWAVKQMEDRYELFAAAGVRDITRYNALVAQARSQAALATGEQAAAGPPGAAHPGVEGPPVQPRPQPHHADLVPAAAAARAAPFPLPYIVIIIDELADLMMVAPVDVEDAIWRLAQMARASGIHLVVATQRPSVDVITGTIKANIPTRVAFAVSSQVDSRTIIDIPGAEKLLGHGDMLFMPVGSTKPVRVQGAYISDREIEALVAYVKSQGRPRYSPDVLAAEEAAQEQPASQEDEVFEDAVRVVMETGQASISMLQRKLRVGYTRAGRLIDMMEEKGIVGPFEGSKAREILMTFDQYRRMKEASRRAGEAARAESQAGPIDRGWAKEPRPGHPGRGEPTRGDRSPVVILPGGRREEPDDEDDF